MLPQQINSIFCMSDDPQKTQDEAPSSPSGPRGAARAAAFRRLSFFACFTAPLRGGAVTAYNIPHGGPIVTTQSEEGAELDKKRLLRLPKAAGAVIIRGRKSGPAGREGE